VQADKFHIAVDVFEDKIEFFGIDMAIDTREGDGEFRLGVGTVVSNIIVEIGIVQCVPELSVSEPVALIHWGRSR
jgi:hypothetical protein